MVGIRLADVLAVVIILNLDDYCRGVGPGKYLQ